MGAPGGGASPMPDGPDTSSDTSGIVALAPARRAVPWRTVVVSWLAARAVVLAAMLLAPAVSSVRRCDSLWGWDGYWYRRIAQHGYDHIPAQGIRFFPGYPELGRALAVPFGGSPSAGVMLVLIANACALAYAALAYVLSRDVGLDDRAARGVVWLIAFTPAAFVLVMAYTEALYGVLVVVSLLYARRGRWAPVAVAGLIAGFTRPTGVLLVLPTAIEAWQRRRRGWSRREAAGAVVAALAPVAGLAAFLAWSATDRGDALSPLRTQTQPGLRGGVTVDPLRTIARHVGRYLHGDPSHLDFLLHLAWAGVALALLIAGLRRLPLSFTAFSAASVALALTARNFASFERYAGSAVPLLLVAAPGLVRQLTTPRRRWLAAAVAVAVLGGYSLATFADAYVP